MGREFRPNLPVHVSRFIDLTHKKFMLRKSKLGPRNRNEEFSGEKGHCKHLRFGIRDQTIHLLFVYRAFIEYSIIFV